MKQDQQLPHEVHEHIDVITNLVQKTIALNHDGVICLESNKIKSALKIFTTAYNTHEKIKIKMNMKKYATAAVPVAVSPTPSYSYHNNNVNELFYQYRRAPSSSSSVSSSESVSSSSSSSSVDESSSSLSYMPSLDEVTDSDMDCNDTDILRIVSDNNIHRIDLEEEAPPAAALSATTVSNHPVLDIEDEIIFRDSIRLPFYEDIFSSTSTFEAALQDQEQHPAFSFLSTCHALNLAIVHHLRGIELLKTVQQQIHQQRKIVSNVSTDSDSNETVNRTRRRRSGASEEYKKHFDKACRLYEQTMNIERTRSKFNDQQDSTSTSWFSPQILLACLNNLGHIHSLLLSSSSSRRSQEQEQCHQYYNRLQSTVHKLVILTMASTSSAPSLARKSLQMSRSMPWMNLIREVVEEEDSNNGDDNCDTTTTSNDIDIEDTYTYLELFWTNSFHGLNRLSTALAATAQQQQQNIVVHSQRNEKSTPRSTSMPSSTASVSTTSSVSVSSTSVSSTPKSITIPKRAATAAAEAASVAA